MMTTSKNNNKVSIAMLRILSTIALTALLMGFVVSLTSNKLSANPAENSITIQIIKENTGYKDDNLTTDITPTISGQVSGYSTITLYIEPKIELTNVISYQITTTTEITTMTDWMIQITNPLVTGTYTLTAQADLISPAESFRSNPFHLTIVEKDEWFVYLPLITNKFQAKIVNGEFDNGLSGWETYSDNPLQVTTSKQGDSDSINQSPAVFLGVTDNSVTDSEAIPKYAEIRQVVYPPLGATNLSFEYRMHTYGQINELVNGRIVPLETFEFYINETSNMDNARQELCGVTNGGMVKPDLTEDEGLILCDGYKSGRDGSVKEVASDEPVVVPIDKLKRKDGSLILIFRVNRSRFTEHFTWVYIDNIRWD